MKKWFTGILAVITVLLLITPAYAALPSGTGVITNCKNVSGSEFSSKSSIAGKLNKMFAGNIGLYKDQAKTKLVDAALGTRNVPNNNVYQYWGPEYAAGTSCFAYANAFYGHFYDGVYPHRALNKNHQKIKATGKITYQNFVKWGVRDDAVVYIREGNHSVIVLHYDENYITYVDGNGDGKGLIALRKEAWKAGSGANIYNQTPSVIVQPTTAYFAAGSMGKKQAKPCSQGGSSHDWDKGTVTKEATCKETGVKKYTCQECGKTKEETIKKTDDHTYGNWTVTKEPTCDKEGTNTAECTLCGKKKTKSVKVLGHSYGQGVLTREATIYAPGIMESTCQRCGKVKTAKSDCVYQNPELGITLTTKEKVFPQKSEVVISIPEEYTQEDQTALREVSGKFQIYDISVIAKETPTQPKGQVTLELKLPEDYSNNPGLYWIGDGKLQWLENSYDPQTRTLTAQLEQLSLIALCDLDILWNPEPETSSETEETTPPETLPPAPVVPKKAPATPIPKESFRTYLPLVIVGAVLLLALVVTVILAARQDRKEQVAFAPKAEEERVEEPTAEPAEETETPEDEEQPVTQ